MLQGRPLPDLYGAVFIFYLFLAVSLSGAGPMTCSLPVQRKSLPSPRELFGPLQHAVSIVLQPFVAPAVTGVICRVIRAFGRGELPDVTRLMHR